MRCPAVEVACLGGGPTVDLSSLRGPMVINFWQNQCVQCEQEMPILQAFHEEYGDQVAVLGVDSADRFPGTALEQLLERGVTYPQLADPGGDLQDTETFARVRGYPYLAFVDADGDDRLREVRRRRVGRGARGPGRGAPRGDACDADRHPGLPDWLRPVEDAARSITVHDLTRFMPPEDAETRESAVLMLFGDHPDHGPDLLLTERSHTMRSHPGQVSFPGGTIDPGETAQEAALREALEETGLDPAGVDVFAELPPLWIPPSGFSVIPVLGWWREPSVVRVVSPDEVHAVYRVPLSELRDPAHRIVVQGPVPGWSSPGFLIGDDHDVICWGFTAGVIARLFEYLGWIEDLPDAPVQELPDYMLVGRRVLTPEDLEDLPTPNTDFIRRRQ